MDGLQPEVLLPYAQKSIRVSGSFFLEHETGGFRPEINPRSQRKGAFFSAD